MTTQSLNVAGRTDGRRGTGRRRLNAKGADDTDGRTAWAGEVVDVLSALPDHQAAALRFSYFHGMSPAEIARRLDMTTGEATRTLAGGLLGLGRLLRA